jgi:hypothetical protein
MLKKVSLQTTQGARTRYDKCMNKEPMTVDSLSDLVAEYLLDVPGHGGWDEDDLEDGVFVLGFVEDQGALDQFTEYAEDGNVLAALDLVLAL